jgi:hypothetical protein
MDLGLTSDAPGAKWCKVWEIEKELYQYEKEIFPKYKDIFLFKLWLCFRCLPKEYKRKSMRRYYKNDNALGIDISIDEEIIRPFINGNYYPLSKDEQRLIMGNNFHPFFVETFNNYKNKLPGINEYGNDFVKETKEWLYRNNWING